MRQTASLASVLLIAASVSAGAPPSTESTPATAQTPYEIVPEVPNIQHLDPGRAINRDGNPFFPSRASTGDRPLTIAMFAPPEFCGNCHTEIYRQWKGSMHSNAWKDPVFRGVLNLASQATGGQVDNLCMGCHTPIGLATGEANPAGTGMSEIANNGVQCDFCHNVSGARGIGDAPYILTPMKYGRPLKFGPFSDALSPAHDTTRSQLHTDSAFCGMCHNVTHPFNGLPIERTYDEWKDSPYPAKRIGCQECHMTPAPGKATSFSKERERVFTHGFAGANALVPPLLGDSVHARQAEENLKASAILELIDPPTRAQPGKPVTITVRVTNVGAGHKLPTGFPEGREMWVDFRVTDARGKEVYRLGAVKDGTTEPGTKAFKVTLADEAGNVVDLEVWKATHIVTDTRLLPMGSAELPFQFQVPKGTRGPLTVSADLNYWSFPQKLLERIMGAQAPKVPIIKMASVERELAVSP